MRIVTASDRALLVELADHHQAMNATLAWAGMPGVHELIPGARTVLVRFHPEQVSAADLSDLLTDHGVPEAAMSQQRRVQLAVSYDGEDLAEVADLLAVSPAELVNRHLAAGWRVAFAGFAPGFGYLACSDPLFQVPRRATPRTRVPAGAVALAGEFTGVYPRESPGGWQLIGHTNTQMWDLDRQPPALLTPGTHVDFVLADRDLITVARSQPQQADSCDQVAGPGPRIEVVSASLPLLLQDSGREGQAHLGVSGSGAADRLAAAEAGRAVGNGTAGGVLESVGAAVLRFVDLGGDEVAVITGADSDASLLDSSGTHHPITHGVPFALASGDELRLGHPRSGLRSYLAVRGGFEVNPVLGSISADTLAGLGPAPRQTGSWVGLSRDRAGLVAVEPDLLPRQLPTAGDQVALRITLGPRHDWFTAASLETLTSQLWTVTPRSDRVGLRLTGDQPLQRSITDELPSEGAVTGSLQVPPDGQPVLFGPDHPLTGGYPIVGAVIAADLALAAQLPPGVLIRFQLVEASR